MTFNSRLFRKFFCIISFSVLWGCIYEFNQITFFKVLEDGAKLREFLLGFWLYRWRFFNWSFLATRDCSLIRCSRYLISIDWHWIQLFICHIFICSILLSFIIFQSLTPINCRYSHPRFHFLAPIVRHALWSPMSAVTLTAAMRICALSSISLPWSIMNWYCKLWWRWMLTWFVTQLIRFLL